MTEEEIKKKLVELVVDKLECEVDAVKEDTRLRDLGADSLDEIELLIRTSPAAGR